MAGYFKLSVPIAQQENYDDLAVTFGWTGETKALDAEGNPIPVLDENGNQLRDEMLRPVYEMQPMSAQEFIADLLRQDIEKRIVQTLSRLERERGTLNYNKQAWLAAYKAALTLEWIPDEV